MNKLVGQIARATALLLLLTQGQSHAFQAQLPVQGYTFVGVINVFSDDVGEITSVYTVPANRIAVITDIHVALSSGATGTHKTFLSNDVLQVKAGHFLTDPNKTFTHSYSSGIIYGPGQQIVVSDTGGTGDVTVNLIGYLVCGDVCE
jgi:hypothetical protein